MCHLGWRWKNSREVWRRWCLCPKNLLLRFVNCLHSPIHSEFFVVSRSSSDPTWKSWFFLLLFSQILSPVKLWRNSTTLILCLKNTSMPTENQKKVSKSSAKSQGNLTPDWQVPLLLVSNYLQKTTVFFFFTKMQFISQTFNIFSF